MPPFRQYGCDMRDLAVLVICAGALTAASCKQSQTSRISTFYSDNRCGPAPSAWSPQGHDYGELMQRNVLQVGSSELKWNGMPTSFTTVQRYLRMLNNLNPPINLQIVFGASTNCNRVNQTRTLVSENFHCAAGSIPVCVEYSESEWERQRARFPRKDPYIPWGHKLAPR